MTWSARPAAGDPGRPRLGFAARRTALAIGLVLAASVLLHAALAWHLDGFLDPDEAIVGLMARHVREGTTRPVFYYGQPYLGALEAYLVAPLAGLPAFPLAARLALSLVSLLLATWTALAAGRAAGPGAALAAVALIAIPPPDVLLWHLKLRGGFIESAALVALALAASVRVAAHPDERRSAVVLGVAAGLALWTSQLTLPVLAVLGAASLVRSRHPGTMLAAAFLGSLPLWVENARSRGATFRYLASHLAAGAAGSLENARVLVADTLERCLGGPTLALASGIPWLHYAGMAIVVALLVTLVVVRARPLVEAARARRLPLPLDVTLLAFLISFPARRNAELNQMLHLLPLGAVLLAAVPGALVERRSLRAAAAARGALWLVVGLALAELVLWLPGFVRDDEAPRALVAALDAHGVNAVHAEHRPAYLIAYYSEERIAVTPSLSYGYFVDRFPPYTARVAADPEPALVFEAGSSNERKFLEGRPGTPGLTGPLEVSGYHVYVSLPGGPIPGIPVE